MENDREYINICIACDDRYAPHAAALIASIMENKLKEEFPRFFVIGDGVSETVQSQFRQMATHWGFPLVFLKCDDSVFKGLPTWRGKYSAYFRLAIHRLIPEEITKVLYLDCDMIVTTNLTPLFQTDISGKYAAVVAEAADSNFTTHHWRYFNSGMTLLNLEKFKADEIERKAIELGIRRFSEIDFPDQDLLNELFAGNVVFVSLRWNTILFPECYERFLKVSGRKLAFSLEDLKAAISQPGIVHFAGFCPWKALCAHPLRNLYWKYVRLTPFYRDMVKKYRLSWLSEPYRRYFRIKVSKKNIHLKLFGKDIISYNFMAKKSSPQ